MPQTKNTLAAVVLGLGIAGSGFFIGHAITSAKQFERFVTVKGLAEQVVKSDQAIWTISFTDSSDDLEALYKSISSAQDKIKNFYRSHKFDNDSIVMQPVSISDNTSRGYNNNPQAKRYTANASVVLTTAKVDLAKIAVQDTGELVKQGVIIQSSTVKYQFTELNQIKPKMLIEAIENAKQAASSFSKTSNSNLAGIRHASQGIFSINDLNGSGYSSTDDVMKKVRVVSTVQYYLH